MLKKLIKDIAMYHTSVIVIIVTSIFFNSCSVKTPKFIEVIRGVQISPDYSGITIPPNIAPLNFSIKENAQKYLVKIHGESGETIYIKSSTGNICIPRGKWKNLLFQCKGKDLIVEVFIKKDDGWIKFPAIRNY